MCAHCVYAFVLEKQLHNRDITQTLQIGFHQKVLNHGLFLFDL